MSHDQTPSALLQHHTPPAESSTSHAAAAAAGHVGLLVCDFDDTITEKDTIGALLGAAVEANVKVSTNSICRASKNAKQQE